MLDVEAPPLQAERLPSHLPELDGLRGLAIALVLAFHFREDLPGHPVLLLPTVFGWSGVDLFFVLSGFLITRILLRTRLEPGYFRNFYMRRALRIFPLYYATLAVCSLLLRFAPAWRAILPGAADMRLDWLYLDNWTPLLTTADQRGLSHFWSLAIEEQFYWMWPLVVWKLRPSKLPLAAAGGIVAALASRALLQGVDGHAFVYRSTVCRMDALMFGALCALAVTEPRMREWLARQLARLPLFCATALGTAMAGSLLFGDRFTYTVALTLFDGGFAMLLLYVALSPGGLQRTFRWRGLRELGKYSYGIYVFHLPVYCAFQAFHLAPAGLWLAAGSGAACFAAAVLSYHVWERRFLELKARF